ncbi:MAG TPA: TlpA disulfide reductase family protein [Pyrinomonadaceae bacterium]|nr:TlpA disulfide reductase family protein [Pyrinomonadaceae bacterium]
MLARKDDRKTLGSARIEAVFFLVLIGIFSASSCNSTDESTRKTTPAVNNAGRALPSTPTSLTTLPPNVLEAELKSVRGAPIKLGNYAGKVLVVNFWATWCGPCRLETPELVLLQKEYKSQGVEVIGLSTESPGASAEGVRSFVKDFNVNYQIGWATSEVASSLMLAATTDVAQTFVRGRDAIPQTFVVSPDGRIVKRFIGFNHLSSPPQLKQAIEDALKS